MAKVSTQLLNPESINLQEIRNRFIARQNAQGDYTLRWNFVNVSLNPNDPKSRTNYLQKQPWTGDTTQGALDQWVAAKNAEYQPGGINQGIGDLHGLEIEFAQITHRDGTIMATYGNQ